MSDVDSRSNRTWVTCAPTEWKHRSWSHCSTDQSSLILHKTQLHHVTVSCILELRNYVNWQRPVHDLSHPGTTFKVWRGITRSRSLRDVVTSSMTFTRVQISFELRKISTWLQDHMKGPSSVQQSTFATARTPHHATIYNAHLQYLTATARCKPLQDATHSCSFTSHTVFTSHTCVKHWIWVLIHTLQPKLGPRSQDIGIEF